jgi:hypothetical protein
MSKKAERRMVLKNRLRNTMLAIRKNETMWFEGKWMQLEDTMVSKVSQVQKAKAACFLSYMGDRSK